MNIFYVDRDPYVAAKYLGDKHVVKMILESTQMLCTAHRVLDGVPITFMNAKGKKRTSYQFPDLKKEEMLYKPTHINHPCNIWIRNSVHAYCWLYRHACCLADEYTNRYNKTHKCTDLLSTFLRRWPENIPNNLFTHPPLAMPDQYKLTNSIESYRNYYYHEKVLTGKIKWKDSSTIPDWITNFEIAKYKSLVGC